MSTHSNATSKNPHGPYLNYLYKIALDPALDLINRVLFGYFWSYHAAGEQIFPSNAFLCELTNTGMRNVQSHLEELENICYIRRETVVVNGYERRIIHVTKSYAALPAEIIDDQVLVEKGCNSDHGGGDPQIMGGCTTDHPYIKTDINIKHKTSEPVDNFNKDNKQTDEYTEKKLRYDQLCAEFERFWVVYPNADNKKEGIKEFCKASKYKVDVNFTNRLIERAKKDKNREGSNLPSASEYIKASCLISNIQAKQPIGSLQATKSSPSTKAALCSLPGPDEAYRQAVRNIGMTSLRNMTWTHKTIRRAQSRWVSQGHSLLAESFSRKKFNDHYQEAIQDFMNGVPMKEIDDYN